jgi:hypothetical protein
MSRPRAILLLAALVCLAQALTTAWLRRLPVYLHVPNGLLRPLLMVGMTAGLLGLLFRRGEALSPGETLALLCGTAGGLANLMDTLYLGAVADFIPIAPGTLASPGDFLIIGGFLSFLPLSLRQARKGVGLYALYRHWRDQMHMHLVEGLRP